jgi:membrane protein DedA with SNARE-associated domain/rhodanese-related sulfurtransferase
VYLDFAGPLNICKGAIGQSTVQREDSLNHLVELLERHGYWVLFVSVVGRQACLPLPTNLLLLAAGALAGLGRLNFLAIIAYSVTAFILADLAWFEAGRKWGTRTLHFFCRVSQDPHLCIEKMVKNFGRHGAKSLLISKFIFGLDSIASPLSGICGISRNQFVVCDGLGALAWSFSYVALGYVFHDQLDRIAADSTKAGEIAAIIAIAGFGLFTVRRLIRWYRFLREFRLAQISPEELRDKLTSGDQVLLLDLQGDVSRCQDVMAIPGAIRIDPRQLEWYIKKYRDVDLATDREVVLYGSCSKESTSARVALALRRRGFEKVRPLAGGLRAWRDRGFPVTANVSMLLSAEHAVFILREILLQSRTSVARILRESVVDLDRILERLKTRIRHRQSADMLLLGGLNRETSAEGALIPLTRAPCEGMKSPES